MSDRPELRPSWQSVCKTRHAHMLARLREGLQVCQWEEKGSRGRRTLTRARNPHVR